MMVKYVLLLKSILDCINVSNEDSNMAAQKLKEAISVMEQVPTKANDAMHLGTVIIVFFLVYKYKRIPSYIHRLVIID